MNWIKKTLRFGEKIKKIIRERASKDEIANSDWTSCCKGPILKKDLEDNLMVCPSCNKHHRINPRHRFDIVFGKNNYDVLETPIPQDDPLKWNDSKPYTERLNSARKKTGMSCGIMVVKTNIKNINLTVNKGEMIGIIGSSGSGKTTIMDLLLCFLKPSNGEILYNKSSIVSNVTEWTSQVAYLPQEVFILDDSLKCNIALGVEESQINDEQVEVAIKQSRLEGLVIKLDNGLDTFIGERGVRLSGGERQRIALARALYHKRDVLFLDESTSSLDMETEKQILSEIKSLKGHKTFVIIAHNYATLKYCDVIYEVIDKELVPRGRYEDIKSK